MKIYFSHPSRSSTGEWIAPALCVAVLIAWVSGQFVTNRPDYTDGFAPFWIPCAAAVFALAGIIRVNDRPRWSRIQRMLLWSSLLLMVWTANGLPFDLFRIAGLMPSGVDWPGLVIRTAALAAIIAIVRLVLPVPANSESAHPATWYGYAAFILALPYPVLRTCWALGGTPGLTRVDAAGHGFIPWLACIPWLLAAVLSLLLASDRQRLPRKLMLTAGWSATAIVAMVGPAAIWSLISRLLKDGKLEGAEGIAGWVFGLFYTSWFLWAIAAAAATRSYQLRSASGVTGIRE